MVNLENAVLKKRLYGGESAIGKGFPLANGVLYPAKKKPGAL
jgi:hypothetical protein